MTTANSLAYLHTAVDSILSQTHSNLELIIVDDSSTDGTFEEALALAASDPRIRPIHSLQSAGTYVSKNLGLTLARGEFVAFQDSDDWSRPSRLAKQVGLLQSTPPAVACTCNYERRDERGALVLNRGKVARRGPISLMFRKDAVLGRLGFFDSVRTSADEEFRERMLLVFGLSAVAHVDESLYLARARAGSLTTAGPAPLNLGAPSDAGGAAFLSPLRLQYFEAYRAWHRALAAGTDQPFMPFPIVNRRFPAPAALLPSPVSAIQQTVHATVASVPGRQAQLAAVVAAIAPQVDVLHVYLNGYDAVPDFLQGNPAVRVARSQDWGDVRDNGKFYFLNEAGSYYVTLDDDLAYPADYVRTLLLAIEKYGRQAVVGVHGVLEEEGVAHRDAGQRRCHLRPAKAGTTSTHSAEEVKKNARRARQRNRLRVPRLKPHTGCAAKQGGADVEVKHWETRPSNPVPQAAHRRVARHHWLMTVSTRAPDQRAGIVHHLQQRACNRTLHCQPLALWQGALRWRCRGRCSRGLRPSSWHAARPRGRTGRRGGWGRGKACRAGAAIAAALCGLNEGS